MEQRDGVDHPVGRVFARGQVVGLPVRYVHEASSIGEEGIPCCVAGGVWALGVLGGGFEFDDLDGDWGTVRWVGMIGEGSVYFGGRVF